MREIICSLRLVTFIESSNMKTLSSSSLGMVVGIFSLTKISRPQRKLSKKKLLEASLNVIK